MADSKNRGGRPRKRGEDEREHLGFQAPAHLRAQIEAAAKVHRRSLSAECVARLEASFREVPDLKSHFGGDVGWRWALLLFATFEHAGAAHAGQGADSWAWVDDRDALESALREVIRTVWRQLPGNPTLGDFLEFLKDLGDREINFSRAWIAPPEPAAKDEAA